MQDFGVNLICVEDGIDSSKDAGKLMISVLSAVAEIERENRMIRLFKAKQVDGIIVAPTKVSKIEIQNLIKEGYPISLI